jgi:hypothetical protein
VLTKGVARLILTHMYGPAVRRKRFRRSGGFAVLHQCIRPLIGAVCAPGHHGYQRACVLISGQASNGPFGSPGFAGAGKTGPPSRFILSQTSAGKRAMSSFSPDRCSSFVRAVRPFLRPGLRVFRGIARRDRQGWPSRLALHHVGVSRPRLDGPEHGATLTQVGAPSRSSWHIRSYVPC